MPKKVSDLIKELDITIQELKGYAEKLGITISSARSSVEDQDAERLARSINMMRGTFSGSQAGGNKPKIKAVPVVHKEGAKGKPMGKPVIPKKPVAPVKEEPVEEAPAAEEKAAAAEPAPEEVKKPAAETAQAEAAEVPAAEKADIYCKGSSIIKCTSKNSRLYGRKDLITHGPNVIFGTKCPSMTSMCK